MERLATYRHFFDRGIAMLHTATADGGLVGYSMTIVEDATDDTFPLAPRAAEVYSLSVAPQARGTGIGGRLLDAVDRELVRRAVSSLSISVMADNDAAIRFYERRGLVPGELTLYRITKR